MASKVLTLIPNILLKSIRLSDKFDCAKTSARGSRRRESGAQLLLTAPCSRTSELTTETLGRAGDLK
jgi:hypothetical protein